MSSSAHFHITGFALCLVIRKKTGIFLGFLTEKFRTDGWIKFVKGNTPVLICCYSAWEKGKVNLF